jgi:spore cortex formation protein SpoVR/YcgB (stage V sporulation)
VADDPGNEDLFVSTIHNERGYRKLRRSFARQYDVAWTDPDIQVVDVDLSGDRKLIVHHHVRDGLMLQPDDCRRVLQHLADLWGYDVVLKETDGAEGAVLKEHVVGPRPING